MPISEAVSASCATARIALPSLVALTNRSRTISITMATPKISMVWIRIWALKTWNSTFCEL